MFRCGCCGSLTAPGEKETKVVTEKRPKTYYDKGFPVGKGWEVVVEKSYCQECGKKAKEEENEAPTLQ